MASFWFIKFDKKMNWKYVSLSFFTKIVGNWKKRIGRKKLDGCTAMHNQIFKLNGLDFLHCQWCIKMADTVSQNFIAFLIK